MHCVRASRRALFVLKNVPKLDKVKLVKSLKVAYADLDGSLNTVARFSTSCVKLIAPEYTTDTNPGVRRGPFAKVTDKDISFFKDLLANRVLKGGEGHDDDLDEYNVDWLQSYRGRSKLVLKPKTTEEVSKIVKYCNERSLAVVPQGGNTSLVGGSVPVFDEIVLSMKLMNQVISLDPISGILICEAGCILENLEAYVGDHDLVMPLDLGAKGSCHIGGNISTNAGGVRLLRYGSLHGSVLGLEVVLPSGDVLDCLSTLRKDNTGYDMKQLFIGSEGTLGVITKAAILCPTKPKSTQVAFLGLPNFHNVIKTFKEAKGILAEVLSAYEFMDSQSMDVVRDRLGYKSPIPDHSFYVLIEVSGSNAEHNEEKLNLFLEKVMEAGYVENGTVATDSKKISEFWNLRDGIAPAFRSSGHAYLYDFSIPLQHFDDFVEIVKEHLGDKVQYCTGMGHLADGNLHLNVSTEKFDRDVLHKIEPFVYELTANYRGSISAEHGLGFKKANAISYSKSDLAVKLMSQTKKLYDPKGIMNPYKLLPTHSSLFHYDQ
ncbi:D-2-hydroxyglutarate dehydrogenase, mitochondrial-like isoform X2 [Lineus longissimus]|uniref:D-2-hydroxyglutarate dehydrogenase, mitochondrial-like isoform X2 n=1 Tax=Lineus longissimus TaxID=88925 RepID=UPI00315C74D6